MKQERINVTEWLAAEEECRCPNARPQGYITTREYAALRGISLNRAQAILKNLHAHGKAVREWWVNNGAGSCYVYKLKKNGRENK